MVVPVAVVEDPFSVTLTFNQRHRHPMVILAVAEVEVDPLLRHPRKRLIGTVSWNV